MSIPEHLIRPLNIHSGDGKKRAESLDRLLEEAKTNLAIGNLVAAEEKLEDARRWNPGSSRLWRLWAGVHAAGENTEKQVFALETAIALCSDTDVISEMINQLDEITGGEYEYCDICGQLGAMKPYYKSFKESIKCPRCQAKAMKRNQGPSARKYGFIILILALIGPVTLPFGGWWFAAFSTNLLLIFIFHNALIPFHELAHAAAALALKGRVMKVQIGVGPKLGRWTIRNTDISLHQYLLVGLTFFGFPTAKHIRLRYFLAVMVGPMLHLVLVLIFRQENQLSDLMNIPTWRASFVVSNFLLLISSGLPLGKPDALIGFQADGYKLLCIIRNTLTARMLHLANFYMGGALAAENGDMPMATREYSNGLSLYPDDKVLQFNRAIGLVEDEQYDEAIPALETVVERIATGASTDAELLIADELTLLYARNALAYFGAIEKIGIFDPQNTVTVSLENYRKAPWNSGVAGTLGTGLVAMGYPAEGLVYLTFALRNPETQGSEINAENCAWTAVALHRLGRIAEARKMLCLVPGPKADRDIVQWAASELAVLGQ